MICILGATGYVGASLARVLATASTEPLVLAARRPHVLASKRWPTHVSIESISEFSAAGFDLVINAIGAGAPARVAALSNEILEITQTWDNRVLTTMSDTTRYVFLSSGAIYGGRFFEPVDERSEIVLPVNRLEFLPPYMLAKLQVEIRHRNLPGRPILDLRIFGYADITIPLDSNFFLAELARCVARGEPFATSPDPMVRDYAGALELADLINCWRIAGAPNMAADLYTEKPVSKHELLKVASSRFGLEVQYDRTKDAPTGAKAVFASNYRKAAILGYNPTRTSIDVVLSMLDAIAGPAHDDAAVD